MKNINEIEVYVEGIVKDVQEASSGPGEIDVGSYGMILLEDAVTALKIMVQEIRERDAEIAALKELAAHPATR